MVSTMTAAKSFAQTRVSQQPSTESHDGEQLDFLSEAKRKKPSRPVDPAYLHTLPTLRRAVAYSLNLASLDPKEVYSDLKMDKASWSRIVNGTQEVPASLLKRLRVLTGNDAPHQWLAYNDGYRIEPLKTEWQARYEAEVVAHNETRRERDMLLKLWKETR
jgi:hypothetical protein